LWCSPGLLAGGRSELAAFLVLWAFPATLAGLALWFRRRGQSGGAADL